MRNLRIRSYKEYPLVSVIIPSYNRGWILKDAIDSVLSQDYRHFELLVIDDGSTDNTQDILKYYKKDIRVICQSNKGVSAARNIGITSSTGSLIAFLDSDDFWLPGKLSRQVDFFVSNPDALICQTEETWIRNGKKVNPKIKHKKKSGDIFIPSLLLCLISPSAVMLKRSLFDNVGMFDETLPACEDYDLWLRISYKYQIDLIDMPLIIKRGGHDDQISKQPCLDKYRIKALKKIINSKLLLKEQQQAAEKVLKEKCLIYAGGCIKRNRLKEADLYMKFFSPGT